MSGVLWVALAGCAEAPPAQAPVTENTGDASSPSGSTSDADSTQTPSEPAGDTAGPLDSGAVPPAASPASSAADESGETRTVQVIASFVKERRDKVRPCYDKVQKSQPQLKGDLMIRFELDPAGKMKKATFSAEESTLVSKEVADCVIAEMKTWNFPASSRGMDTSVGYPFNFNPRR